MSNNMPDYNDNLVFTPTITWSDLVEWVKEIDGNLVIPCIAINRTPEQMKIILENLIK